ncbi:MAG: phosphoribosylglycinamide formyltransferase [Anaerolineae bacterium]|nr:phosphoribosylglycinamide formyltransferase [Anaerolineae bacterium]
MRRLVVMVSGSGTNLQALIDAIADRQIAHAEIVLVVSNRKGAYALTRAEQSGIPTLYFPLKPYHDDGRSRADYDTDLAQAIAPYQPDLIVLAGWMHILGETFLARFPQQVINLHPALPGMFAGTHAIERAFEAYQRGEIPETGCMIHYVIPEVDAGAVILQRVVPIQPDDTLADFEARLHQTEHALIVEAVAQLTALSEDDS